MKSRSPPVLQDWSPCTCTVHTTRGYSTTPTPLREPVRGGSDPKLDQHADHHVTYNRWDGRLWPWPVYRHAVRSMD